ncbi:hypothetical protein GQX74_015056 [Glossina fuscipes]|nr:hypothetical protein GQX74_015056 [Glossina fuscipes]
MGPFQIFGKTIHHLCDAVIGLLVSLLFFLAKEFFKFCLVLFLAYTIASAIFCTWSGRAYGSNLVQRYGQKNAYFSDGPTNNSRLSAGNLEGSFSKYPFIVEIPSKSYADNSGQSKAPSGSRKHHGRVGDCGGACQVSEAKRPAFANLILLSSLGCVSSLASADCLGCLGLGGCALIKRAVSSGVFWVTGRLGDCIGASQVSEATRRFGVPFRFSSLGCVSNLDSADFLAYFGLGIDLFVSPSPSSYFCLCVDTFSSWALKGVWGTGRACADFLRYPRLPVVPYSSTPLAAVLGATKSGGTKKCLLEYDEDTRTTMGNVVPTAKLRILSDLKGIRDVTYISSPCSQAPA